MYGLLHCLPSKEAIAGVVAAALEKTKIEGHLITVCFNDRSHDLSAHPGFSPCLVPHDFLTELYQCQNVLIVEDELIWETHPHNNIRHHHSLSRFLVQRKI